MKIQRLNMTSEKLYPVTVRSASDAITRNIKDRYEIKSEYSCAFSGSIRQHSNENSILPPSSVFTGTRFIKAKNKLHTQINCNAIPGTNIYAIPDMAAQTILTPAPANATVASLLYGSAAASERITAPNGKTVTE